MSDERPGRIEQKIDVVISEVDSLKMRVESSSIATDRRLDKLEITQEEMKDHLKQVAEGHAATLAAIAREGEKTRAYLNERLVPLEAAVRHLAS